MNSYASVVRTLVARNVLEKQLAPPADVTVVNSDLVTQVFNDGLWQPGSTFWITGGNIIVHRIGIFGNFTDGLVFKTPGNRLRVRIDAIPYQIAAVPLTGTLSWPANSKVITGVGTTFNTELVAGNFIKIAGGGSAPPIIGRVVSVDPLGLLMAMSDYGPGASGMQAYRLIDPGVMVSTSFYGINNFNYMYEHERFMPVSLLGGNQTGILLQASLGLSTGVLPAAATQVAEFMTRTIDTSFDGEIAYFDVIVDVEMTPAQGLFV